MRQAALVIAVFSVLMALPLEAGAHGGAHWTTRQAEKYLGRGDAFDHQGNDVNVTSASCSGFGHTFIARNGHRAYARFRCRAWIAPIGIIEVEYKAGPRNRGWVAFIRWLCADCDSLLGSR
jgi:hypothetical protein